MITAKEEAKELVDRFYHLFSVELENSICIEEAKACALVAVDKMLDMLMTMNKYMVFPQQVKYYQEVKHEIEKL